MYEGLRWAIRSYHTFAVKYTRKANKEARPIYATYEGDPGKKRMPSINWGTHYAWMIVPVPIWGRTGGRRDPIIPRHLPGDAPKPGCVVFANSS